MGGRGKRGRRQERESRRGEGRGRGAYPLIRKIFSYFV
jgi:hypothetical protein